MTKKVDVEPEWVQAAGVTAVSIGKKLKAIADACDTAISPGASAWGDDKFGSKFADGGEGFKSGGDNMADATSSLGTSLGNLGTGLQDTAKKMVAMEQGNTQGLRT
ncbi:hypothetical protein JK358_12360 [Nocardia sp. 2]|uniref:WXG100 family type VII secretion target n=1 Tax=Nocardia acididurans TaxID=2802282 RepID=A0ABS1M3N6_9NOCA|nr:hypothetical protein [Nocardia acididurans]MBL1075185.1 hypothetical protein [Nocardia acididurans]